VKTTWDASVRARAGFLVDPAILFYATGGPAWLHVESTSNCGTGTFGSCSSGLGPSVISNSTTKFGYTVGAGIEAMLTPNWIARGEYRFSDFGTIGYVDSRGCGAPCGPFSETISYDVKVRTHTATFGLAYLFSDPTAASASATLLGQRSYAATSDVFSWTGFYLGAGVGVRATAATASLDSLTGIFPGGSTLDFFTNCTGSKSSGCNFDDPLNGTAFRFSPYAGYNWQIAPRWVAGIEGDFGWANEKTTLTGNYAPGTPLTGISHDANDTFSVKTT
jgi:outer membrane immunogenic protein